MDERAPQVRDREEPQSDALRARRWCRVAQDEAAKLRVPHEECAPFEVAEVPARVEATAS